MPLTSFRDVIDLWPTKAAMAQDVQGTGQKMAPTRTWYERDRIPPARFDDVLRAAKRRGFDEITYRLLTDLHQRADQNPA